MIMFRNKIRPYSEAPVSHQMVMEALVEYRRPNDKISELIKRGELVSLRRGLYIPGADLDLPSPNTFLIANHLRGPSYVSLESALSYWGMIPERVYGISSVTLKTAKIYNTAAGRYSFEHLNAPYYSFGIQSVILTPLQTILIASPEKALCDKIVLTTGVHLRSVRQTERFLFDDLRINEDALLSLNTEELETWIEDAPKSSSLEMLVKTLNAL